MQRQKLEGARGLSRNAGVDCCSRYGLLSPTRALRSRLVSPAAPLPADTVLGLLAQCRLGHRGRTASGTDPPGLRVPYGNRHRRGHQDRGCPADRRPAGDPPGHRAPLRRRGRRARHRGRRPAAVRRHALPPPWALPRHPLKAPRQDPRNRRESVESQDSRGVSQLES